MLAWRTSSAQCLLSGWRHFRPSFSRCGHRSKSETGNHKIEITKRPHQSNGLSLIEELFPEHARQNAIHAVEDQGNDPSVPRLPLPEVDDLLGENRGGTDKSKTGPKKVTKAAATNAFRRQQLAVLSLDIGSKSLVESDFLRITPKGQHIEDWTGPGDIVKSEQYRGCPAASIC